MPTECSAELFDFAAVEGRAVVAGFDGGAITPDAGALLLGATDRAIRLVGRFAECFIDRRRPELVEHLVATLVGQRVFAIALGYGWSLDFQSDALADGRRFRVFAVVDDFTRECLALIADTSLPSLRVVRELAAIVA